MQDIPAASTKDTKQSVLLATPKWDTTAMDNAAFSDLLAHESSSVHHKEPLPTTSSDAHQEQLAAHQKHIERKDSARQDEKAQEAANAANAVQEHVVHEASEEVQAVIDAENNLKDMKDVPVDMESFQAMRPQLERYGISDEDIATLERKVGSEKGFTWGEMVSFISQHMNTSPKMVDMTTGQQQKLMTFFQKIGFSAPESKRMVADLQNGNASQVNAAVQERLTTLPQDKLAGLDKEELDAFNELIKKFQGKVKAEDRALVRVVGKAMENAVDKARRMAHEKVAEKHAGVEDSSVKTLAQTASAKTDTDISKAALFSDESPQAEQARTQAKDAERLLKSLSTEDQLKARVGQAEENIAKGTKLSQHKDTDAFLQQDSGTDEKAWSEFFQKLQLDESEATTIKGESAKGFAESVRQARSSATNAAKHLTRAEAPRVLKQVENALLKNLTGGGKRLTLQLAPEHLGALNISLTVKNSEVSATIRADNVEAGKMLADQIETIRHSLEDQGLKVSKLEVQTQLQSGGEQGAWQSMSGQDKAFQQGMWQRMHQGMNGGGDVGMSAAQLSEMAREAILSENGNGLHVVA